jgi:hypothetical protein
MAIDILLLGLLVVINGFILLKAITFYFIGDYCWLF